MKNLRRLNVPGHAPEDVLFDGPDHIIAGLKDSNCIVRVAIQSGETQVIAVPGGRALGLDWLPDGRLLVCNADLGLQAVDVATGKIEAVKVTGEVLHLCNNAHVLGDGTIFVSDSSSRFDLDDYPKDLVQNTRTGRLLKITPGGAATVLLEGLCFANGVAVLEAENAALVAATGTCDIQRVDLTTGVATHFASVDGHPDNISIGQDGRVWVAVPSAKNAALGVLHNMPLLLRKLASNLPSALQPQPQTCCRVFVLNPDGTQHAQHEGVTTIYNFVTGVRAGENHVALASIAHDAIAVFERT